jgi:acetoin utilization deacetylase AcuC-like enzyme
MIRRRQLAKACQSLARSKTALVSRNAPTEVVRSVPVTPHTNVTVRATPPAQSDARSKLPPVPVFYDPGFKPPAGIGRHMMPIDKFRFVFEAISGTGLPMRVVRPQPIPIKDIERVHSRAYIEAIQTGRSPKGYPPGLPTSSTFPWSEGLFQSVRLTSGAEYAAALEALKNGEFAFAPVSGFHHARPDRGDGYCTFNGLAITAKKLIAEGQANRVLIVDNDFHYGNGTAKACADTDAIFTFSVNGQAWDQIPESPTNRNIELPASGFARYMEADREVEGIIERFKPDVILFQAGMDPLRTDSLSNGHFNVGHAELKARDTWMFETAKAAGVPIVANLAGGYSYDVNREPSPVVVGHLNTFLAALEVFRGYETSVEAPLHARTERPGSDSFRK